MDNKEDLPLLLELWEYVIGFAKQTEGYSAKRICKTIRSCCELFTKQEFVKHQFHNIDKDLNLAGALLYNEKTTCIYRQLASLIPVDEIKEITIICPYYDKDGTLLKDLCKLFPNSILNIYLQENEGLPPTQIEADKRITFYDFNKTNRGKVKTTGLRDSRMLHAKVFHFKSQIKEYCLVGSANATIAAMGSFSCPPLNDELCILYASSSFNFLNNMGINKSSKPIKDISIYSRSEYYGENILDSNYSTRQIIKSADLEGKRLKVYINSKHIPIEPCYLTAFGIDGIECFSLPINDLQLEMFEFILSPNQSNQQLQYCAFFNANGNIVSNKQLVNNVDKLRNTNPERNLRSIREILSKIEVGQFNELEIADYLTQLYREDTGINRKPLHSSLHENKEELEERDIITLSYDQAIAMSNNTSILSKMATGHITSTLWQSIESIFQNKSESISDELMDEEEEASTTESKDRKIENIHIFNDCIKIGNDINRPFNLVKKITEQYCINLTRARFNEEHVIGIVDYLRFLLSSHTIGSICLFNEYTLFPEGTNIHDWKKKLRNLYSESIQSILKHFILLHQYRNIAKYSEWEDDLISRHADLQNKFLYHILLDATLAYNTLERREPVIKEQLILFCLNIFNKYGLPNSGLKDYMEKLSIANNNAFSPQHVLKMLGETINASKDGSYKKSGKLGICKINTIQGSKYQVRTIYDDNYRLLNKKDISDFTL
ncbi:hypothetical protein DCPSUM001_30840 [Dysgonomonas capnocytophagoides]|nr:hypothetical protein DCPSUM001_30840 [Dysgonomonas capnocytophagoides]